MRTNSYIFEPQCLLRNPPANSEGSTVIILGNIADIRNVNEKKKNCQQIDRNYTI